MSSPICSKVSSAAVARCCREGGKNENSRQLEKSIISGTAFVLVVVALHPAV